MTRTRILLLFVAAAVTNLLFAVANVVGLIHVGSLPIFTGMFILGANIGFVVYPSVRARYRRSQPTWCPDCGSRMLTFTRQSGFHTRNGSPRFVDRLACPDWDPLTPLPILSSWTFVTGDHGDQVYGCGNLTTTEEKTLPHTHPVGQVETNCIRCLVEMEKIGALEHDEVSRRIKKLMT